MRDDDIVDVGVIGVGSMGQHHARVYGQLSNVNLVGVADASQDRATEIARKHGVRALPQDELLEAVDAVSIAVPTDYHVDIAEACLDQGVNMLIEKPIATDPEAARALQSKVAYSDVIVQVGHIERFNPAVQQLAEILQDVSILSIRAHRLGPQPDRYINDSAVFDLMIHDLDIVQWLLGESPVAVHGVGVDENRHASAMLEFRSGAMASLTASRKTQRRVRTLEIIADECYIELDYQDQSIEIHRDSVPEYVESNGDVRFVHESIVERPRIETEEPLRCELAAFVDAVEKHRTPEVTLEDGIDALELVADIEQRALREPARVIGDD